MAKWLRDYLSFGGRRPPPQPPTPDYTESDILRAYLEQKNLDFEDPYEDADSRLEPDPAGPGDSKYDSPKHRLIKVEAADMAEVARAKVLLGSAGAESEVDTEYSDPFDAQPHPPPPDDGYMEPYDAQRVVSELPCRAVQLYDTPYEEQDGDPGDRPFSGQRPGQSRQPQEDERPADEYDQPWEWKKDHISKAFAVQFDSPEWERTPGSAKELRKPPPRSPHLAERVDPALPLEKQPWFHGPLSRADAENLLLLCKEGSYLVRLSETSPQDCSLSLRSSQGFLHLKFAWTRENQLVLGQHSGPFASVPELVLHYSSRPLPVQGAEHLALLYPVVTQSPCPGASAPGPAP
ncbi:PREDICTED: SH2 domain-containing adapter protein D [Myotis davidii]|uniref:SH2 domain-containing adapter protein D n=1 Tax=Myotis davidii TaxID=225400 RepID=L5MGQ0_MYODS|nr:PREDICTED: SH2 domain-containing adapter protein D [Myotis davidii]ELK37450.1 SH2 domain-containing adapter protein D [Myotis davidii]